MAGRKGKSKKHSYGKERNRPLKGFTLYLCENVDCDEAVEALRAVNVRCKRHKDQFPNQKSVPDEVLLPLVGAHRWILITTDQKQRTTPMERLKIVTFRVRQFVFTSGNLGKTAMVDDLIKSLRRMREMCKSDAGPFSASISKGGHVKLRTLRGRKEI